VKIYTKTGDKGQTGLVGGGRVEKDSLRIQAIGEVDELNAAIGVARCYGSGGLALAKIQNWLFDLGAELATPEGTRFQNAALADEHVKWLEQSIDKQTSELPALKNFILPAGTELAAALHYARCVCRRAERSALALQREEPVREVVLVFLNRLSDWLFVSARTANRLAGVQDVEWKKSEEE